MPFNPTDELTMKFTAAEWNQVIGQLQEGPYKLMAPLINKMNVQAAQQEQREQQQQKQQTVNAPYTNGEVLPDAPARPHTGDIVADVKVE